MLRCHAIAITDLYRFFIVPTYLLLVNRIWTWNRRGGGQINGVCVSPTSLWQGFGPPVRACRQTDPVRRSKSQGTSRNKLQKCFSSVSCSDEGLLPTRNLERVNLLASRQYCSFGSVPSRYKILTRSLSLCLSVSLSLCLCFFVFFSLCLLFRR